MYLSQAPGLIDSFEKALKSGDDKTAVRHVHSLKSSSRSIGAMRLGDIAAELEALTKEEKLTDIDHAYIQLKMELENVKGAISVKELV